MCSKKVEHWNVFKIEVGYEVSDSNGASCFFKKKKDADIAAYILNVYNVSGAGLLFSYLSFPGMIEG